MQLVDKFPPASGRVALPRLHLQALQKPFCCNRGIRSGRTPLATGRQVANTQQNTNNPRLQKRRGLSAKHCASTVYEPVLSGVEGLDTIVGTPPPRGWPRLQEMRIVVGFKCNRGKEKAGFRGLCSRDCTYTHPRGPFAAIAAYAAATQASLVTK